MTALFQENGARVPVTIVEVDPCSITQIKNKTKNGYKAIQIGTDETTQKHLTKPEIGHLKPVGKYLKHLCEFRLRKNNASFKIGDILTASVFQEGDYVTVSGISKGKGYQGVVKRHGFAGSPASHGHKDQLRMPGSIGATSPQRVIKGKRMAGHMGDERVTVKNLEIIKIDQEKGRLYLKGSIPGARGGLLKIKSV